MNDRVLLDTNVLISLALAPRPGSPISRVVTLAVRSRVDLLVAAETIDEFRSAMTTKPSLRRRFPPARLDAFAVRIGRLAELLPPLGAVPPPRCRDPRDDYLLEQAIRSGAGILLTGDDDLLSLENPPTGLRILSPRSFVDEFAGPA